MRPRSTHPIPSRLIVARGSAEPDFSSTNLTIASHNAVPATSTARSIQRVSPGSALCTNPPNHQKSTPTAAPAETAASSQRPIST